LTRAYPAGAVFKYDISLSEKAGRSHLFFYADRGVSRCMDTILYIDAFSGISGDMFLGALIATGLDVAIVQDEIGRLDIGAELSVKRVKRNGIEAVSISVVSGHREETEREYGAIKKLIESRMSPGYARDTALKIFGLLAHAEGRVHGRNADHVHFHEVGAVDSIVDIVGAAVGLAALEPIRVVSSPLPMGRGFVTTRHGVLPLPAPATVELLSGVPVSDAGIEEELVTPTGAAIVKTVATSFSGIPPMIIERSGYGAGDRQFPDRPNLLRLIIGRPSAEAVADEVEVITTHIDDMNPQFYEYVMDRLFALGALDAVLMPVIMKKGRPATALVVIAPVSGCATIIDAILSETTSIGLRVHRERRVKLERRLETVKTQLGEIRVKFTLGESGEVTGAYPEYEDVRAAAEQNHVPIDRAYRLIIGAIGEPGKGERR
jgi:pyridinium-3,5-bisthiocarboxylic acid mononucleotide nickel chelatase